MIHDETVLTYLCSAPREGTENNRVFKTLTLMDRDNFYCFFVGFKADLILISLRGLLLLVVSPEAT